MRVKSNLDSGIPQAIQRMAIAALEGPQDCIEEHNAIYQRRRDRLVEALRELGLRVRTPKASLYVWARVPEGITSASFAARLLDEAASSSRRASATAPPARATSASRSPSRTTAWKKPSTASPSWQR